MAYHIGLAKIRLAVAMGLPSPASDTGVQPISNPVQNCKDDPELALTWLLHSEAARHLAMLAINPSNFQILIYGAHYKSLADGLYSCGGLAALATWDREA